MKITNSRLKQIIKEELGRVMEEEGEISQADIEDTVETALDDLESEPLNELAGWELAGVIIGGIVLGPPLFRYGVRLGMRGLLTVGMFATMRAAKKRAEMIAKQYTEEEAALSAELDAAFADPAVQEAAKTYFDALEVYQNSKKGRKRRPDPNAKERKQALHNLYAVLEEALGSDYKQKYKGFGMPGNKGKDLGEPWRKRTGRRSVEKRLMSDPKTRELATSYDKMSLTRDALAGRLPKRR